MLSQNQMKYLRSLERKKNRLIENKILLDGRRLIDEAINHQVKVEHIWISKLLEVNANKDKLINKIEKHRINFSFEKDKDINKISNTKNSQGIIALISTDSLYNKKLEKYDKKIVILDQISDPGNLGTIIRTCAWFGINSIILTENSADIFNDKCIRSAVGGHFYIDNFKYLSVNEIVSFLKINNYNILCADLQGQSINKIKPLKKWALILGSEAHGVDKNLKIGKKITITQIGNIESLNVSVACGIILNKLTYQ